MEGEGYVSYSGLSPFVKKAVPYSRWLVAGFSQRKLDFFPRSGHVGFAVDKSDTDADFLRVLLFPVPLTTPHS
jgi:hypothetical protein